MRPSRGGTVIEVGKSQNGGLKTGRLKVFKSLKSFGREVHSL